MFTDAPLPDLLARAAILPVVSLVWVVFLIRVNGLRSLSKMTNFDFVMTVAMGSLLASAPQATDWETYSLIMLSMAALFAAQWIAAWVRLRSDRMNDLMHNKPVLLMQDGEMLVGSMRDNRVTEADLRAKLREANALDPAKVRAVVLETTGDISVLHGERLDETLLRGIGPP